MPKNMMVRPSEQYAIFQVDTTGYEGRDTYCAADGVEVYKLVNGVWNGKTVTSMDGRHKIYDGWGENPNSVILVAKNREASVGIPWGTGNAYFKDAETGRETRKMQCVGMMSLRVLRFTDFIRNGHYNVTPRELKQSIFHLFEPIVKEELEKIVCGKKWAQLPNCYTDLGKKIWYRFKQVLEEKFNVLAVMEVTVERITLPSDFLQALNPSSDSQITANEDVADIFKEMLISTIDHNLEAQKAVAMEGINKPKQPSVTPIPLKKFSKKLYCQRCGRTYEIGTLRCEICGLELNDD